MLKKNKQFKKISLQIISCTLLITSFAPSLYIFAYEKQDFENIADDYEDIYLEDFEIEQLNNIDWQSISDDIYRELGIEKIDEEEFLIMERGVKGKAAKIAAKEMIKKIKSVGVAKWTSAVKKVVGKLPLSKKTKNLVIKYLGYHYIMDILNVVSNFTGKIEDALTNQLIKMKVNKTVAGVVSRTLTTVLF